MYIDNDIGQWLIKLVDPEYTNGVKNSNNLSEDVQKKYGINIL
jgi:hypothetical protein